MTLSILSTILPSTNPTNTLALWLILFGWLGLLSLLGTIAVLVYLVFRPKSMIKEEKSSKKPSDKKPSTVNIGLLVASYFLQFISTWVLLGASIWLFGAIAFWILLKLDFSYYSTDGIVKTGHFLIPYITILLTFPVNFLLRLKSWRAIRLSLGQERKQLINAKEVYLFLQLFFSAVFLSLFSGLFLLVFVFLIAENSGYSLASGGLIIFGLLLTPNILTFLTGISFLVELLVLGRRK